MAFSRAGQRVFIALLGGACLCAVFLAPGLAGAGKKPDRTLPALSEPQRAAASGGGTSETSGPGKSRIFQFALQNGMQVVVIPDHRAPVVTQMLWYRVGGIDDPPGLSGLAHFFEHMMFRGTKALPGNSFALAVAKNGGQDNAFTTSDYTAFYEQIAKDRLKTVMGLEADRMAGLDLSDKNVRTERDVVMEERRMRVDNDPQALLGEQMAAALNLSHPYGTPVIGWMSEIRHIDRASASSFYDRHYGPNNAILIVDGDVTADNVRHAAAAAYAKLPAREIPPRADYALPPRLGPTRITLHRADAKLPLLRRDWRVVSYCDGKPGQAEALDVLAMLLGGDSNSALYRELVVNQKLAADAGASYDGMKRDSGTFSIYAVPRPGVSLERLEKAADAVLASFRAHAPAAADLARAKTQLIADTIYRRDSQFAQASAYGQALVIGLTIQDVQDWPQRIGRAGASAVQASAVTQLLPEQSVTGYLIPGAAR